MSTSEHMFADTALSLSIFEWLRDKLRRPLHLSLPFSSLGALFNIQTQWLAWIHASR